MLRYWVTDFHVDGFRFDLASVLGRAPDGRLIPNPPALEMIADDGVLAKTKLIAEPWDAGGAYQVGEFPFGHRWADWNDRFRDDVRRFWRGEEGLASAFASRVCGSEDIFARTPRHSVNFVTCHDGFTLHDVVSYNGKHNEANGEQNRDGSDANSSWNGGAEGPTDDPAILALRERRAKSLMATLLLAQGTPMILAGDELLRTQKGNNNAWCQDNDISWVDWSLREANAGFLRFVRELIWVRRRHPVFRRKEYLTGERSPLTADVRWHGELPNLPNFGPESRFVAMTLDGRYHGRDDLTADPDRCFYVAFNGADHPVRATVPPAPHRPPLAAAVRHRRGQPGGHFHRRFRPRRQTRQRDNHRCVRGGGARLGGVIFAPRPHGEPNSHPEPHSGGRRRGANPARFRRPF